MKNICILGSTGSIGTQALDIIKHYKEEFNIVALSGNNNIDLLEQQIYEFNPRFVAVFNPDKAKILKERLINSNTKVLAGLEGLIEICTHEEIDVLLTSVVGTIGLIPTLEAIKAKKTIALANKETLVTAGKIVMEEAKKNKVDILPVDSEHSAIFQCLQGYDKKYLKKIILTASGGPFRGEKKENLINVKPEAALKHPKWKMGKKITVDSATLMNKGLEVIEAKWLFDLTIEQIDVIIHPQSIIHSLVEFIDGSLLAQLGTTNMKLPILYALSYPERKVSKEKPLDLMEIGKLTFEKPDLETFPCLQLAYDALKIGGTMPTVLNAANEELVKQFLDGKIKFYDIPSTIEKVMERHNPIKNPTIEEILEVDLNTRKLINSEAGL